MQMCVRVSAHAHAFTRKHAKRKFNYPEATACYSNIIGNGYGIQIHKRLICYIYDIGFLIITMLTIINRK